MFQKYLFLLLFSVTIYAGTYLNELVKQAENKKLHEKRMWHILMHYNKAFLSEYKSEADGEKFFFAKDGKRNPESELRMTLKAFFDEDISETDKKQHPQCQFPARFKWLSEQLNIDKDKLPKPECRRFKKWKNTIKASGVTMIFSDAYLNNPASMYGHTFLRLDRKGMEKFPLLGYVVNFSALPTTNNPLIYTVLGLLGGFKGEFTTIPYYLKVKEYGSMESRDLWEYKLNLTQKQIDFMLRHIWELGSTYFNYFYLDENCSYHILSLIEVANPEFNFREMLNGYTAIPSETLKLLKYKKNFIKKVVYRPSILTKMMKMKSDMSKKERDIVLEIVDDENFKGFDKLTNKVRKAQILNAALLLIDYRNPKKKKKRYTKLKKTIMLKRSKLRVNTPELKIKTPFNPINAHPGGFLGVGFNRFGGENYYNLFIRTSLNDLLSDHSGFISGSAIELSSFSFNLKMETIDYYPFVKSEVLPGSFNLIKITSLSPLDSWVKKVSWRVWIGADTRKELGEYDWSELYYGIKSGFGGTLSSNLTGKEFYYAFFNWQILTGGALDSYYSVGVGPTVGVYFEFMPNFIFNSELTYVYSFLGDKKENDAGYLFNAGIGYTFNHYFEIRGEYQRRQNNYEKFFINMGVYY